MEKLRKKLLLILCVLIACIAMNGIAKSYSDLATIIAIDPYPITIDEPGKTFIVRINITESPAVVQWMARVSWNPAVLNITKKPVHGPWLSQDGALSTTFLVKPINYTGGYIPEMTERLMEAGTTNGSGVMVIMNFTALAVGESDITIFGSALLNITGQNQTYSIRDGRVTVVPEFPTPMITAFFLIITAVIVILAKKVRPTIRRERFNAP